MTDDQGSDVPRVYLPPITELDAMELVRDASALAKNAQEWAEYAKRLESIVAALAKSLPLATFPERGCHECLVCHGTTFRAQATLANIEHVDDCPWLAAKRYMESK